MTPEERAKMLLFGDANWPDDGMSVLGSEFECRVKFPRLVAAIRDAVKAETEECANLCERKEMSWASDSWDAGFNSGCISCADAIRARTP